MHAITGLGGAWVWWASIPAAVPFSVSDRRPSGRELGWLILAASLGFLFDVCVRRGSRLLAPYARFLLPVVPRWPSSWDLAAKRSRPSVLASHGGPGRHGRRFGDPSPDAPAANAPRGPAIANPRRTMLPVGIVGLMGQIRLGLLRPHQRRFDRLRRTARPLGRRNGDGAAAERTWAAPQGRTEVDHRPRAPPVRARKR